MRKRTFCVSDLHGNWDLYQKIKEYIQPDDIVYFLGDAADRGADGWAIIKSIINDPQWIYIMGNHEKMLANAIKEYYSDNTWALEDMYLLEYNGGECTFNDWIEDGAFIEWANQLNQLPTYLKYINKQGKVLFLSHAGYTPSYTNKPTTNDLLWSREHFWDKWPEDQFEDYIIIHGHTPAPYLKKDLGLKMELLTEEAKPFWYCDNHKCDLDMLTIKTKTTCLMDLDTFDYVLFSNYFDTKEVKYE